MKILYSADWHIKLGQKNVPTEWSKNRFRMLFDQLHELEKECDLHVIGGDVFDKVPSMQELELYFEYVVGADCDVIIYPGNHESTSKYGTFFTQLKEVTNKLNKNVVVIDDYYKLENMDFIPYNRLKQFKPEDFSGNICFTHVRGEIPPHVKPEVDLDLFDRWDTVYAGDLHSHSNSQRNIVYPGSPLTTSFHREEHDTGVLLIDSENNTWTWEKLNLPQLIRKTIKAGEEMLATEFHHTIYEVAGDMEQLGSVEDSELLDKKIVKKAIDCALVLDPNMSIEEELTEYLQYILELNEDAMEEAMKEFNSVNKTR